MKTSTVGLAIGGLTIAAAQSSVTCRNGVHIIAARGSDESVGVGELFTPWTAKIVADIPDSDAIGVPYPAIITDPKLTYVDSEQFGVGNITQQIEQYGDACAGHKIVLMGYSQGAQVVSDAVIGANYTNLPAIKPSNGLPQKYLDDIVAIVLVGDVSNVAGEPFLYGTSTRSGIFARANAAEWAKKGLVSRVRSYCDADDLYCDHGTSHEVHDGYGPYIDNAAEFVERLASAGGAGGSSTAPSGSATASGSTTTGVPTAATTSQTGGVALKTNPANSGAAAGISFGPVTCAAVAVLQCAFAWAFI